MKNLTARLKLLLRFYYKKLLQLPFARRIAIISFVFYTCCFSCGYLIGSLQNVINRELPVSVVSEGNEGTLFYDYDQEIKIDSDSALLTIKGTKLIATKGVSLTVYKEGLSLTSGIVYIISEAGTNIFFSEYNLLLLPGFSGVVNADNRALIVFIGQAKVNDIIVEAGQRYGLDGTDALTNFDRKNISASQIWINLFAKLPQYIDLPDVLADLEAPVISDVSPQDGTETTSASAELKVLITGADKVTLNGEVTTLDTNSYLIRTVELNLGVNTFTIRAEDNSGNFQEQIINIIRRDPCEGNTTCGECGNPACAVATQPPASNSCGSGSFNSQLQCLINAHRNANGKGSLSMNTGMNNAAQGHSEYMNSTGNFSHTGAGGSSFDQRCAAEGESCDAENIAMHSNPSAQNIFNLWKNSAGHNANMLGSHTLIGIGKSGNYVTAVFK